MEYKVPMWERRVAGLFVRKVFLRNRRGGPWPVPEHLPYEDVSFRGNTGAQVAGRYFYHDHPHAVVVAAHPDRRYGQHWFLRSGWIEFLHGHGLDVLTFDFPGYGQSHGPATYYHEDVAAAVSFARRWSDDQPVHIVGLSMGAFAAINASPILHDIQGLILESPYPSFNSWYDNGAGRIGMEIFDRLFPRSARVIQAHRHIETATAKRILVAGTLADEVTPIDLTRRVAAHAPPERTEYLEVPDAPHLGLLATSAAYRQAVARTLGLPSPEKPRRPAASVPANQDGAAATRLPDLRAPTLA